LKNEQRPPRQSPEQQPLLLLHVSPSGVHDPFKVTHVPLVHWLLQHCAFDVHAPPAMTHLFADEHVLDEGSQ
jgi:hypothetical protein